MYLIRNRVFTKIGIDSNFQFISDNVEFKFIGRDINQIREYLNELVKICQFYKKKVTIR